MAQIRSTLMRLTALTWWIVITILSPPLHTPTTSLTHFLFTIAHLLDVQLLPHRRRDGVSSQVPMVTIQLTSSLLSHQHPPVMRGVSGTAMEALEMPSLLQPIGTAPHGEATL